MTRSPRHSRLSSLLAQILRNQLILSPYADPLLLAQRIEELQRRYHPTNDQLRSDGVVSTRIQLNKALLEDRTTSSFVDFFFAELLDLEITGLVLACGAGAGTTFTATAGAALPWQRDLDLAGHHRFAETVAGNGRTYHLVLPGLAEHNPMTWECALGAIIARLLDVARITDTTASFVAGPALLAPLR